MAKKHGVDPRLARAVAKTESGFNPAARSPVGAIGLMQLMPPTAARHGLDPNDPIQNIEGGVRELRQLLDANNGDVVMALRRYNASPQAGDDVTEPYVQKVLGLLKADTAAITPGASPAATVPTPPALGAAPQTPTVGAAPPAPGLWDSVSGFAGEATKSIREGAGMVNDMVQQAFWHPIDSAKGIGQQALDVNHALATDPIGAARTAASTLFGPAVGRVKDAYASGDVGRTLLEAKNVPLDALGVGTRLSQAEEHMRQGEIAKGLGATADVGFGVAGPQIASAAGRVRVLPALIKSRLPAVKEAAVAFGDRHGVSIDLGTATNNQFGKRIQAGMESTPGGAAIRASVDQKRGQRITDLATELSDRVHPVPTNPEVAGAALTSRLEGNIGARHLEANSAYDSFRAIEADPANTRQVPVGMTNAYNAQGQVVSVPVMGPMQMPVSLRPVKRALRPMYERLRRTMPATQAEASPGLKALGNLLDGPDFAPASQIDMDLSTLKTLARGADLPELRDLGQGIAAKSLDELSTAIDRAVGRAGPQATKALTEGRLATRRKYAAKEVYDQLKAEPVGAFKQATAGGDANINQLRDLAREAPGEMKLVGRAVLDELIGKDVGTATKRGGYERAAHVANQWERLGPETRKLLFGPQHTAELDHFFLLTRMLAEHPNPSRSALSFTSTLSGAWMLADPATGIPANIVSTGLAALMNSRRGVRLLTRGLTLPATGAAATAWGAEVAGLLENDPETRGRPRQPAKSSPTAPPPRPPASAAAPPAPPRFGA